jgi:hypothetical protein
MKISFCQKRDTRILEIPEALHAISQAFSNNEVPTPLQWLIFAH